MDGIIIWGGNVYGTGVGVWMFGRMFPERKSSSEYRWAKMILLTLLILTTYTMHRAYGQEYIYEKFFFYSCLCWSHDIRCYLI